MIYEKKGHISCDMLYPAVHAITNGWFKKSEFWEYHVVYNVLYSLSKPFLLLLCISEHENLRGGKMALSLMKNWWAYLGTN